MPTSQLFVYRPHSSWYWRQQQSNDEAKAKAKNRSHISAINPTAFSRVTKTKRVDMPRRIMAAASGMLRKGILFERMV